MSIDLGESADRAPTDDAAGDRHLIADRPRLVLLSFLMLFVELAIIRWAGANVVYLAYVVLIAGLAVAWSVPRAPCSSCRWCRGSWSP